jgi:hypothetical protein
MIPLSFTPMGDGRSDTHLRVRMKKRVCVQRHSLYLFSLKVGEDACEHVARKPIKPIQGLALSI